jgi:glycosyltransferase involved in cell wall biosynthesis
VRIVYFSKGYSIHDHRFLSALERTDHEVHFLRLEANSPLEASLPIPNEIKQVDWNESPSEGKNDTNIVRDLNRIFDEINPDVVHAGPVQLCAFLVAMTEFKPLLTMSWGSDLLRDAKTDPGRTEAILTLDRSSLFACDCETVAKAAQALGMPREKITIFPWGVDLEHFIPGRSDRLRSGLGWEDANVLLSTRSHEEIYGVEILVDAFIRAATDHTNLRLLLLNGGSLLDEIKNAVGKAGMDDRVHFAGEVGLSELPEYYRSADLYVSASRSDGSSISLLEAMASGLPSVVSDIPGNREWVEPGLNGWWFNDGDPDALARIIGTAVQETSEMVRFGANAREIAEKRANWDENFSCLLDAYQRVHDMSEELQ